MISRQYYSREYDTTNNNRPSSPTTQTPLSSSTIGGSSKPPRRWSPPTSSRRLKSSATFRNDYSRAQHTILEQDSHQQQHQHHHQQQHQQESARERLPNNTINSTDKSTNNHEIGTKTNNGGSSPNSVIGLNVKDLASRYGGKTTSNHNSNHPDPANQYKRTFQRSPNRMAKTKVDGNIHGAIECTLTTSLSTADDSEFNDTDTFETTSKESHFGSSSRGNLVPHVKTYLQLQNQRSHSRSPLLGRHGTQSIHTVENNDPSKNNSDSTNNGHKNHEIEVNSRTPIQKKWGWPSPKKHDHYRTITNVDSSCTTSQGEKDNDDNDDNNVSSSTTQYLQVLKQYRHTSKNTHGGSTMLRDDSIDFSNVMGLVSTNDVDHTSSTMKAHTSEMGKIGQNRWGIPSTSTRKNYKYTNNTFHDADGFESNNYNSSSSSSKWSVHSTKKRGYPKKDSNVEKHQEQNEEVDLTTTNDGIESSHENVINTPIENETNAKSVLQKAHFWRNQLSNQQRNSRIQPRNGTVAGITSSNSFESLGKKSTTSKPTNSNINNHNNMQRQERYLTSGSNILPPNEEIISQSKSSEALFQSKLSTADDKTFNTMSASEHHGRESTVPNSKSSESLWKETRGYKLAQSKHDTPTNAFFSRHLQYMQSKSQNQYTFKDNTLKNTSHQTNNVTSELKGSPKIHHWNYQRQKDVTMENKSNSGSIEKADTQQDDNDDNDEPDSFQEMEKNSSPNENNELTISNSFEKYQSKFQSKSSSSSSSTAVRSMNKNVAARERVPSPIASISSSYDEKLQQNLTKARQEYSSIGKENTIVKQSTADKRFESNSEVYQRSSSKPNIELRHKFNNKESNSLQSKEKDDNDDTEFVIHRSKTNLSSESSSSRSHPFHSKPKSSSEFRSMNKVIGGNGHELNMVTPQKDTKQPFSNAKKDALTKDNQKASDITPRRTAMERFIEGQMKPPESVSPSRKSLHERIRKFDTGGEVPLPVPHCKMTPKPHHKLDTVQKEEKKVEEENKNFEPLLNMSDTQDSFEERNDSAEIVENLEETTIADKSLSLSVSEAKARLWNANEQLQAWPKHSQKDVPVPAPSPSKQTKSNFKSKLYERAAEAAQTIRRTSSSESREGYRQNDRTKNREFRNNLDIKGNNDQSHALAPHPPSMNEKNLVQPSMTVGNNLKNSTRQQVQQNIQSQSQQTSDSIPAHKDQQELATNQKFNSIEKLMAKLASVRRDDPTAALKAIDSILRSERKELGMIVEEGSTKHNAEPLQQDPTVSNVDNDCHEQAMSEIDDASSYYSDSDDSTVSAITDPTYQSGFLETSSVISYSTVSRNGKKRQFSYHVTKGGAVHHQCTSARPPHHRSKKFNGHLNQHPSLRHQTRSPKGYKSRNISFCSDGLNSSTTMLSPPILERTTTTEKSEHNKPKINTRGGMSADNQRLLRKINTWDENDEIQNDKPTTSRASDWQPTSPAGSSERRKGISSKEHTSPSEKIKKLARVVANNGKSTEHLRMDTSPARRFLYPSANPTTQPEQQIPQDAKNGKHHTELPQNIASAFDDVDVSFGSQNVYNFKKETKYSFLAPLKKKFSKVEQRYRNNDP